MTGCCIVNCGARKNKNQPQLTLHRFPKNERLRKKWLETIGEKNINPRHKDWYVCSLHFEESSFNRTLDLMRLHDNSVPTIFSKTQSSSKPELSNSKQHGKHLRLLEISPLNIKSKKNENNLPVKSVPATQIENPLFLENEPMDEIDQDSDRLSLKSESISIISDGYEEYLESEEEIGDEQVESGENVKRTQENDDEQDDDDDVDDDKDDDYKVDDDDDDVDDDDASDITVTVSNSSSDLESFEEMPIPIPTTMATSPNRTSIPEPAATADLTITTASGTIVLPSTTKKPPPNNQSSSTTTTVPVIDHASPAYKQAQLLQRQKETIETQRRKISSMRSQLFRRDSKLKELRKQISLVKEYTKCSEIENILRGNYRKLCTTINKNGVPVNYSDDVIKFAITLNYYSPKAYEFIRKYMSLPNTRMLENYASTGTYIINLDD